MHPSCGDEESLRRLKAVPDIPMRRRLRCVVRAPPVRCAVADLTRREQMAYPYTVSQERRAGFN